MQGERRTELKKKVSVLSLSFMKPKPLNQTIK